MWGCVMMRCGGWLGGCQVKREVFSRLSEACADDCILASNTSTLSLHEIASTVPHPQRVIGLHFFRSTAPMLTTQCLPPPSAMTSASH